MGAILTETLGTILAVFLLLPLVAFALGACLVSWRWLVRQSRSTVTAQRDRVPDHVPARWSTPEPGKVPRSLG